MSELIEAQRETSEFVCDVCGFKALNKKGLSGHKRLTHKSPTKSDSSEKYIDEAILKAQKMTIKAVAEVIAEQQKSINDLRDTIKSLTAFVGVCPHHPIEQQKSLGANVIQISKSLTAFQARYLKHEDILHHVMHCLDEKGLLDLKPEEKEVKKGVKTKK